MRLAFALLALIVAAVSPSRSGRAASKPADAAKPVDFERDIRPILESRCQPCHFKGGKVYDKLPFDRPETIRRLGEKLFTRIKAEDQRRLIRDFLAQETRNPPSALRRTPPDESIPLRAHRL